MMRSSISVRSSWGTLSSSAVTICVDRSSGRIDASEPLLARPIGLRAVATMTASGMMAPARRTAGHDTDGHAQRAARTLPRMRLGASADDEDDAARPPRHPWRPSWARHAVLASSVIVGACLLAFVGTSARRPRTSPDRLRSADVTGGRDHDDHGRPRRRPAPAAWPGRRARRSRRDRRRPARSPRRSLAPAGGTGRPADDDDHDAPRPPTTLRSSPAPCRRPGPAAPPPPGPPPPWAGSVTTTAAGYVGTSVGCASGTSAAALDAFFAARLGPVMGHDYQHVYPLGGDRYLWLFQDTFLDYGGTATNFDQASFVHNTAMVQRGTCFTLMHRGTATAPASFEPGTGERRLSRWFWPLGGETGGGRAAGVLGGDGQDAGSGGAGRARLGAGAHVAGDVRHDDDGPPRLPARRRPTAWRRSTATPSPATPTTRTCSATRSTRTSSAKAATAAARARPRRCGWPGCRGDSSTPRRSSARPTAGAPIPPTPRPFLTRYHAENPMQPRYLAGQWVAVTKVDGYWAEELSVDVAVHPWGPWHTVARGPLVATRRRSEDEHVPRPPGAVARRSVAGRSARRRTPGTCSATPGRIPSATACSSSARRSSPRRQSRPRRPTATDAAAADRPTTTTTSSSSRRRRAPRLDDDLHDDHGAGRPTTPRRPDLASSPAGVGVLRCGHGGSHHPARRDRPVRLRALAR